MHLPDLPPNVRFNLLPRTEEAFRFSFEVKRAAMGCYIIERWGWNEAYQEQVHRAHFEEKPFFEIVDGDRNRVPAWTAMTAVDIRVDCGRNEQ